MLDYHEHAIGGGADAKAVAYIELRVGERTLFGVGIDPQHRHRLVQGHRVRSCGAPRRERLQPQPVADPA